MNFLDKLSKITQKNNTLLCIGLDSDIDKIPPHLKSEKHPQFVFNKTIIDATFDLVCAYKPNVAFYEAEGVQGIAQLRQTISYIKEKYEDLLVILDAKRGDIGNTNEGYVKFAFDYLVADGITLNPYLGKEALKPFLDSASKGVFILCRTSNSGAGEFQDLQINGKPLYQIVAEKVVKEWNYNGNCGLVVGATYPTELEIVRRIVGDDFPLLIPGIGVQGGDIEKTVKAGVSKNGQNAIINVSRSIIFASAGKDFAEKARLEARKTRDEINKYRLDPLGV